MEIFKDVRRTPEFEKDLQKLKKRFGTIEDDLKILIEKELMLYHKLKIDNNGVFPISGLGEEGRKIFKVKKFACRSLKGKGANSGMRLIYEFLEGEDILVLIEIYYKGDKKNEDRERIHEYCKNYR